MTQIKKSQRFDAEDAMQKKQPPPAQAQYFQAQDYVHAAETKAQAKLAPQQQAQGVPAEVLTQTQAPWMLTLVAFLAALVGMEFAYWGYTSWQAALGWRVVLASFASGAAFILAYTCAKQRLAWRRWHTHLHQYANLQTRALNQVQTPAELEAWARQLADQLAIAEDHPAWVQWRAQVQPHHNQAQTLLLFDHHVLTPIDEKIRQAIVKRSTEAGLWVALSPMAALDMLVVAYKGMQLTQDISRCYAWPMPYGARLRLAKAWIGAIAAAGISEWAAEATSEVLALEMSAKVSLRAAQGLAAGWMMARLGLYIWRTSRPLPFATQAPSVKDLTRPLGEHLGQTS
ncbi:putative membrane protein [Allopseudospirillum japonicum]|uniref:Putative membrane protein n=1 Tax=Allopseudospirillum japonicum TaxID=64971 RepID=A0A1H6QC77_9GAMM|nr:TIGR01620 family protein [Allopseudospirillum japonicum]SEI37210.1 putative membrane protein [Allopseudospirillum japonicum]